MGRTTRNRRQCSSRQISLRYGWPPSTMAASSCADQSTSCSGRTTYWTAHSCSQSRYEAGVSAPSS
ncbi:hypothetical protein [Actinomadura madurae]|uniref:hypothetical protein n=1 Tax=Actinomadura madurae TaxID=1993 RepID=UPI0020D226EA|nr:hypothetical protein [Actinomadura madurae]MCQ0020338.1 hypothetical protein [Actinomadura madurae]